MSYCGAALLMLSAHWFPSGKEGQSAHNRVVLGSENPPSRSTVNQALGNWVAGGVLGRLLATALCAVPLLIPVSALIWAHERP